MKDIKEQLRDVVLGIDSRKEAHARFRKKAEELDVVFLYRLVSKSDGWDVEEIQLEYP